MEKNPTILTQTWNASKTIGTVVVVMFKHTEFKNAGSQNHKPYPERF